MVGPDLFSYWKIVPFFFRGTPFLDFQRPFFFSSKPQHWTKVLLWHPPLGDLDGGSRFWYRPRNISSSPFKKGPSEKEDVPSKHQFLGANMLVFRRVQAFFWGALLDDTLIDKVTMSNHCALNVLKSLLLASVFSGFCEALVVDKQQMESDGIGTWRLTLETLMNFGIVNTPRKPR